MEPWEERNMYLQYNGHSDKWVLDSIWLWDVPKTIIKKKKINFASHVLIRTQ